MRSASFTVNAVYGDEMEWRPLEPPAPPPDPHAVNVERGRAAWRAWMALDPFDRMRMKIPQPYRDALYPWLSAP